MKLWHITYFDLFSLKVWGQHIWKEMRTTYYRDFKSKEARIISICLWLLKKYNKTFNKSGLNFNLIIQMERAFSLTGEMCKPEQYNSNSKCAHTFIWHRLYFCSRYTIFETILFKKCCKCDRIIRNGNIVLVFAAKHF